jgi:hypothetical protein
LYFFALPITTYSVDVGGAGLLLVDVAGGGGSSVILCDGAREVVPFASSLLAQEMTTMPRSSEKERFFIRKRSFPR